MMSLDRGRVIAGVCAILMLGASFGLVVSESFALETNSVGHRFAENAFAIAALASLLLVFTKARERRRNTGLGFVRPLALGAAILPLVATAIHYRAIFFYPAVTAIAIGLSLSSLVFVLSGPSLESNWAKERFQPTMILATLLLATLALRQWAPGSVALAWFLTPVAVLLAPGLGFGALLLPRSTPLSERLLWSPPISVGVLVVSLMWLDLLGVTTTRTGIMALIIGWTLVPLPFLLLVEDAASPSVS